MKTIPFDYEKTCQIDSDTLKESQKKLVPEIERIYDTRTQGYENEYASVNIPSDENLIKTIHATVKAKKALHPTTLVVIGIGGSNLGTMAVLEALCGKFYNEHHDIKVYFVDTVDS